jgi:hypothetical protein
MRNPFKRKTPDPSPTGKAYPNPSPTPTIDLNISQGTMPETEHLIRERQIPKNPEAELFHIYMSHEREDRLQELLRRGFGFDMGYGNKYGNIFRTKDGKVIQGGLNASQQPKREKEKPTDEDNVRETMNRNYENDDDY